MFLHLDDVTISDQHFATFGVDEVLIVVALCYAPAPIPKDVEYAVEPFSCCDGRPACHCDAEMSVFVPIGDTISV